MKLKYILKHVNKEGLDSVFIYFNDKHLSCPQIYKIFEVPRRFWTGNYLQYIDPSIDDFVGEKGYADEHNLYLRNINAKLKSAYVTLKEINPDLSLRNLLVHCKIVKPKKITFYDFATEYINTCKSYSTKETYKKVLNKLIEILGKDFEFKKINSKTVSIIEKDLKQNNFTDSSVKYYIKFMQMIYAQAAKTPHPDNPMKPIYPDVTHLFTTKLNPTNENAKKPLEIDDFKKFFLAKIDPELEIYRDLFVLQFLMAGSRISDALKLQKTEVGSKIIKFVEKKTKKKKSVELIALTRGIVDKYFHHGSIYVVPLLKVDVRIDSDEVVTKEINRVTSNVNVKLKKIAKIAGIDTAISSHVARHTFATIADQVLGGDLRIIQNLLNHHSRTTTEKYIHTMRSNTFGEQTNKIFETAFNISDN